MRHDLLEFLPKAHENVSGGLPHLLRIRRDFTEAIDRVVQKFARILFVELYWLLHMFSPSRFFMDFFNRDRDRNNRTATVPRDVPKIRAISALS